VGDGEGERPVTRPVGRVGPMGFTIVAVAAGALAILAWVAGGGFPQPARGARRAPVPADEAVPPPPLPVPISDNAVAAVETRDGWAVFSFLGIDSTRQRGGITNTALRWDVGSDAWRAVAPVPGQGRLAATAQAVGGRVYLFGGYTVAEDGSERSLARVDAYDPGLDRWSRAAPMPTPVDDAVSGVWRDSLVYLVSGWHDTDNVAEVQVYDPAADAWRAATPIPGPPVFGHAGGLTGDVIVYIDGARMDPGRAPRFVHEASSWLGRIDHADPTRITWHRLPDHPGPPLYRAASGAMGRLVVFAGGTDNPYNYDGIGYDGVAAEPRSAVFAWDVGTGMWRELAPLAVPTMDHRGLAVAGERVYVVGGMSGGPSVTAGTALVR